MTGIEWAVGGAVTGLGTVALMTRFLNSKIDTQNKKLCLKQDKAMCDTLSKNFTKLLDKESDKADKMLIILREIQISQGKIEQKMEDRDNSIHNG